MNNDLQGKVLLYLRGIPRAKYVVQRARQLGIYVIVTDYDPNSPAKAVASETALVDYLDVDALEAYCRERKVEGIMSGYLDTAIPVIHEVCKRLGLPCYTTETMINAATDKSFFKQICNKNDVPVPQTYTIDSEKFEESIGKLPYPIFIKPLDASGSRGADVCLNADDFKKKYDYAISWSKKGVVTIEDFLKGTEFILDYMLVDGKPHLASMADRYTNEGHAAAINCCNLMVFPSKNLSRYNKEINPIVCKMFEKEGFRDGVIFMQGYVGKNIKFYEMGCRLGGTWPYIDEHFHGINPMDMLFRYSLTGKMLKDQDANQISADFKGNAAVIYFLAANDEGDIEKVTGVEEIKNIPYVVSVLEYYKAGDHFAKGTLTDVLFLGVHLVADNFVQLKERIKKVYELVGYYDKDGKSLLSPVYDVEKLEGYEQ